MSYTFDGVTKTITLTSTTTFTIVDLYSRWKDWVALSDNSKYAAAFRSVGGDPIGGGQVIAPYIFLNTVDGWRIKPYESDHELRITGNLYSEDSSLTMFIPTSGGYAVNIIIERSASAIAMTVGGIDQATVQSALTAQGYTTARAPNLDNLDAAISSISAGLTVPQATMLLELYRLMGLDPTKPLIVQPTRRESDDIVQTITQVGDVVTVQRT